MYVNQVCAVVNVYQCGFYLMANKGKKKKSMSISTTSYSPIKKKKKRFLYLFIHLNIYMKKWIVQVLCIVSKNTEVK